MRESDVSEAKGDSGVFDKLQDFHDAKEDGALLVLNWTEVDELADKLDAVRSLLDGKARLLTAALAANGQLADLAVDLLKKVADLEEALTEDVTSDEDEQDVPFPSYGYVTECDNPKCELCHPAPASSSRFDPEKASGQL
jgi:hypothetical protein